MVPDNLVSAHLYLAWRMLEESLNLVHYFNLICVAVDPEAGPWVLFMFILVACLRVVSSFFVTSLRHAHAGMW